MQMEGSFLGTGQITLTLEGLAPQSSQESLLLLPATLAERLAVLATGGRLELLFDADGAGGV